MTIERFLNNKAVGFTLSTIMNYGEQLLIDEIKAQLLLLVSQTLGSSFHDRTAGAGIAFLENENIPAEELAIIPAQIVMAVGAYNQTVDESRRVITSQELIDMEVNNDGEFLIHIYFMLYTDYLNNKPEIFNIQKVI